MEPRLEMREGFTVMGIEEPCRFDEPGFFDGLWAQRYMARDAEIKPFSADNGYYGVYSCSEQGREGVMVLAGMAVTGVTTPPEGLVLREIPGGLYAVVETGMAGISQTWNALEEQWLPNSAYERCAAPDFEYYPPTDVTGGEMKAIICIPVRLREKAPAAIAA